MSAVTLHHGDCLDVLRSMPDASVDAVVTDPPYGLEFMGKAWDRFDEDSKARAGMSGTGYTDGAERLERPSFLGGLNPKCRTCQRWQRGGNPCSCERPDFPNERRARSAAFGDWCEAWTTECLRVLKPGGHMLAFGGARTWHRLACAVEDAGFEVRDSIAWLYGSGFPKSLNLVDDDGDRTGWGTALKPAFEPIVVARRPLVGTVAANVLAHGTGALNVDGCRIEGEPWKTKGAETGIRSVMIHDGAGDADSRADIMFREKQERSGNPSGRWPANVVLDESQAGALDEQSGVLTSGANPTRRGSDKFRDAYGEFAGQEECTPARGIDKGGASRFFYVAKAPAKERPRVEGTAHPTVKPLTLMRWLVRLVTPPGCTVLDPFAGSGTTVEACLLEGFDCVAIEREADYLPLIQQRIDRTKSANDEGLFEVTSA